MYRNRCESFDKEMHTWNSRVCGRRCKHVAIRGKTCICKIWIVNTCSFIGSFHNEKRWNTWKKDRTNTGSTYLGFRVTDDQANLASGHLRASTHATVRFNTEFRTRSKIPGILPTISHPFSIFSRRSYILLHSPIEYAIDLFCSKDENLMDFGKVLSRRNVLNLLS